MNRRYTWHDKLPKGRTARGTIALFHDRGIDFVPPHELTACAAHRKLAEDFVARQASGCYGIAPATLGECEVCASWKLCDICDQLAPEVDQWHAEGAESIAFCGECARGLPVCGHCDGTGRMLDNTTCPRCAGTGETKGTASDG